MRSLTELLAINTNTYYNDLCLAMVSNKDTKIDS